MAPSNLCSKRRQARGSGQALLEFVIILPLVLSLMLGVIEVGRLFAIYSGLVSASREAARYGAGVGLTNTLAHTPPYEDCSGIQAAARRIGVFSNLENVQVRYDNLRSLGDHSGCPAPAGEIVLGSRISVTTTVLYEPLIPVFNLPPIPLTSQTMRTIVKGVFLGVD